MPVGVRDLTTLDRVSNAILRSDAEDALTREVFNSSGDFSDEGIRGITSASRRVKSYLKRELIVSSRQALLKSTDWQKKDRTPDNDYIYRLKYSRIREWPILSVTEDTTIIGDRKIFAKDDSLTSVNYFAGYRRPDQVLGDFSSTIQSEFSSEDDIPELPEDIEDVVIHLAIHFAMLRISGLVGKTVSEQDIGDFSVTVRKAEASEDYENRQLKRIQNKRYFT